jgi:hypothetical protein
MLSDDELEAYEHDLVILLNALQRIKHNNFAEQFTNDLYANDRALFEELKLLFNKRDSYMRKNNAPF